MIKTILPAAVGFLVGVLGLVCLAMGKGLDFVILCLPFIVVLIIRVVIQLTELLEITKRINDTMIDIAAAVSSDFNSMREYVDDEVHEVYVTMANDRFGDSD